MERVLGIGGLFLRARDPDALNAWYRDALGLDAGEHGMWEQQLGPTVLATFPSDTDDLGTDRTQNIMLNFRVRDIPAMLTQLRAAGTTVADDIQTMDGVSHFAWVTDPEGNRMELGQPA